MNAANKTSRILGVAFLLQFVTSFASAIFLRATWFVTGNMSETLIKIANNSSMMRLNILFDMLTALGVIFLGAILFITVRKQNEKMALTALGFYILEAALLAVSRIETFSLLRLGQEYVSAGQPAILQTFGNLAFDSMEFVGSTLHMLAFCLGAILFLLPARQSKNCSACSVSLGSHHSFPDADRNSVSDIWLYTSVFLIRPLCSL